MKHFVIGQNNQTPFSLSCRGSLTVQFLLGFVLILSFVMLFSAMTLTLAVSGVTQYMTYSASRVLFLSDGSKALQQDAARDKYNLLITNAHFSKFFTGANKLFEIKETGGDLMPGDGLGLNRQFSSSGQIPYLFYGVWTKFIPRLLEMDAVWGSTEEDAAFFETAIGSYLGRESTIDECEEFFEKRWEFIAAEHGIIPSFKDPKGFYGEDSDDNGC